MTRTHSCPGGCGAQVAYNRLACAPCWARLPQTLRTDVNTGWARRNVDPMRHRRAIQAAMLWFRGERT